MVHADKKGVNAEKALAALRPVREIAEDGDREVGSGGQAPRLQADSGQGPAR